MANATLQQAIKESYSFSGAARACARKVAIALLGGSATLAIVGKAIEEQQALGAFLSASWAVMLQVASLGGHFWGATAVGTLALSLFAWASCVYSQVPMQDETGTTGKLIWTCLISVCLWLISYLALQNTYVAFDALTVYERIAFFAMSSPLLIAAIGLFAVFVIVADSK